jgi:hypothetical protein
MGTSPTPRWTLDPDDPRAPPQELWDRMSEDERLRVVANLPSEFEISEAAPPEGDTHYDAVAHTRSALRGHFRRLRRRIYVGNGLPVYYPGEAVCSPDLLAVLDVEDRGRDSWIVSVEGKGLDLAMEIHWLGHRKKDVQRNVERYARLGIAEYFVCDLQALRLHGHRLPEPGRRAYQPIVPQAGRYSSAVLGLEVGLEGDRLRFFHGLAALPDADELVGRLDAAVESMRRRAEEEAQRAEEEAQRADKEARRAEEEARRAEVAERDLAEARAEIARLRSRLEGNR